LRGQFFTPDESRYLESRNAAALILQGHVRAGIAQPFATGDHPGFKLLSIAPALIEAKFGENSRIPVIFLRPSRRSTSG